MMPKGATLQKVRDPQDRRYAITPEIPGGFVKPEFLRKLADAAEQFDGVLKCTAAQRIMITMLKEDDVEKVWSFLGMEPKPSSANCVRSIKMCPGNVFCKRGKQDSVKLGMILDKRYSKQEMPSKMKMGVAGCLNSCGDTRMTDIGAVGYESGWTIYVGGNAGAHPRIGDELAKELSTDEALQLIDVVVRYYKRHAGIERLGAFIDRIGFALFQEAVLGEYNKAPLSEAAACAVEDAPQPPAQPLALSRGELITRDSLIGDIIRVYPEVIPVLRQMGMGCLGCPSSAGESVANAAGIHGLPVDKLVGEINEKIQGGLTK